MLLLLSGDMYAAIDIILFSGAKKYVKWESPLKFVKYTDKTRYALGQHFWIKKKVLFHLTLLRMGIFRGAHGWGGPKKGGTGVRGCLKRVCHIYPAIMTLDTVAPYQNKIKNYI